MALHAIAECDEMVRSAHHDIDFLWSGQCIHQRDALHGMADSARWFAEFILEPFAPLKGKLREGLTMTLVFHGRGNAFIAAWRCMAWRIR
jgi:hypothetical protein